MYILTKKLQLLKVQLKVWNRDTFGYVHSMEKDLNIKLLDIKNKIALEGCFVLLRNEEILAQLKLEKDLAMEENFWLDKSRLNWKQDGDRNTAFYHRVTKIKNTKSTIYVLKHGNLTFQDPISIANHAIKFFTKNFYFADDP